MTYSRSRTRRFLLQSLYARSVGGDALHPDDAFFEDSDKIDPEYAALLEKAIFLDQKKILGTIYEYAPKYDIKTLATINAIILMICLAELLIVCPDDVPTKVSVNEAIELAKRYSDDAGKNLINGILNTILANRDTIKAGWSERKPLDYECITTPKL